MPYSNRDYQQLCASLNTVTDLVCDEVDIESVPGAISDIAECLIELSRLIVEMQKVPILERELSLLRQRRMALSLSDS